jgi:hypothetical protein
MSLALFLLAGTVAAAPDSARPPPSRSKPPVSFLGTIDFVLTVETLAKPPVVMRGSLLLGSRGTLFRLHKEDRKDAGEDEASVLRLHAEPGYRFFVNEDKKTYRRMHERPLSRPADEPEYAVERVEQVAFRGYRCKKVTLKAAGGTSAQLWLSPEADKFGSVLDRQLPFGSDAVTKTLRRAGIEGWPVKAILEAPKSRAVLEISRIAPTRPSAKLFDLSSYEEEEND